MAINIELNDENFRYDVFLIFNIFYLLEDVLINKSEANDFEVFIESDKMILSHKDHEKAYELKENKKESIKRGAFKFLTEVTGEEHPWGTMVGIRPSKIASSLLKDGKSEDEIVATYKESYLASAEKSKLCIEVAKREEKFLKSSKDQVSIYVGMPFCPTRCLYCSFASNPISACKKQVPTYLEALKKEINAINEYILSKSIKVNTVYFGGGTPTSVNNEDFEDLMKVMYEKIITPFKPLEFTVECGRPDSITEEKLITMKNYEVSRISINPQSMNNGTLRTIGRGHTKEAVVEKFNLARKLGFENINMDIIVGLPGEGIQEVNNSYKEIMDLKPDSLTVHGMSIKRASRLHEELVLGRKLYRPKQEELKEMYDKTRVLSEELGMNPYYMYRQKNMVGNMENIGYSKEGSECIYNIVMIEDIETIIALGADAVSKVVFKDENRIERTANVKDVNEYINRIDEMIENKISLLNTLYK